VIPPGSLIRPARRTRSEAQAATSSFKGPAEKPASSPGVFAAGDVRHGSVKRSAAAVGEGAIAVTFIHRHLMSG
jgi:thioredoxin reductase (NADPH)